ncbi:MAG TPA: SusC/RagA family TonB-linked outer membrane protein [Puia sp.]|nr:SusC/RagA family TonB-linked outer membrane protein [Puia sp.]
MRKKRLLLRAGVLCCLLIALAIPAFSQNNEVTGKITDSTGAPLVGASVTIPGTSRGTTTDANGVYHLTVAPGDKTLLVTAVGFTPRRVPIGGSRLIILGSANSNLNEVVVIGYGTQLKKDLTGSVASVNAKDFQKGAITSFDQLIAGKIAGVSVTSNGGQPGSASTIRIRGLSSISGNNDPLYVLDGLELPASTNNGITTTAGINSPLDFLNPDDVANVTVLKDAASAAIYGSRASAGVIMINTKRGTSGSPIFNFNTSVTAGTIAKYLPVLSAGQFRNYVAGQVAANPADSTFADLMGGANTNWQKLIYQTAIANNDNISISGTAGRMPYRISLGYHDETGILKTDNLQREALGIHLSPHLLNDQLKIDVNLNGLWTQSRFANTSAVGSATAFDPTQSPYQKGSAWDGYFEWTNRQTGALNALATKNPLALLEQDNNSGQAGVSMGNVHADYQIPHVSGLHAIADLGYYATTGYGTNIVPADAAQQASNSPGPGLNSKYKTNTTYVQAIYQLNYIKDIPSIKSNINLTGLYTYANTATTQYNYVSYDAAHDTISGSAPVYPTNPADYSMISYVGRLIYTFNQKYILTASIRDDRSSKFSPSNREAIFPAISAAWRIKQEKFLSDVNWLTDLKLRGSYGKTGNQDGINDYEYVPVYSLSSNSSLYKFGNTFYDTYAPAAFNANIKWEQTTSADVGLDFSLFRGRVIGAVDYYDKSISQLFFPTSVPAGTNFTNNLTANIGTMTDHGVEVALSINLIKSRNFNWDVDYNIAYNKNTITRITVGQPGSNFYGIQGGPISGGTGNQIQIQTVGYDPYSFFVLQQVYAKNGQPLEGIYVDRNRDGVITPPPSGDAYHDHSPYAPVIMGMTNRFDYKKWSLTIVARANVGNYMYNNVAADIGVTEYMLNPLNYLTNASTDIYKSHFYAPQYYSDYYVENASFLRVDNIGINYRVGRISNSASLNLSANCQNVFVITKYSGQDPEVSGGIDNNLYPRPRDYTIGASLNF